MEKSIKNELVFKNNIFRWLRNPYKKPFEELLSSNSLDELFLKELLSSNSLEELYFRTHWRNSISIGRTHSIVGCT